MAATLVSLPGESHGQRSPGRKESDRLKQLSTYQKELMMSL